MKKMLRTFAVLSVLGATLVVASGALFAAAPGNYGWWYRFNDRSLTGIPVPQPPSVPEEGMFVGRDAHPEEALGISAMNFDTASGTSAILELTIAPDSRSSAAAAEVVACPTTSSFPTEFGALWQNRPQAQCVDGKVMGEVSADDSVMTWELTDGFEVFGGFWSLVLAPDCRENVGCEEGSPETKAPFQIAFEEPDAAVFTVHGQDQAVNQPPPPEDVQPLDPGDSGGGDTGGGGGGGGDTGGGATGGFGGTSGSTGSTGGGGDLAGDTGTTGLDDDAATGSGDSTIEEASAPRAGSTDDSLARTVGIALLAALGAGLWLASGLMARRRPVASFAGGGTTEDLGEDEEPGGLGRFLRPRSSGPRRLR